MPCTTPGTSASSVNLKRSTALTQPGLLLFASRSAAQPRVVDREEIFSLQCRNVKQRSPSARAAKTKSRRGASQPRRLDQRRRLGWQVEHRNVLAALPARAPEFLL